MKKPNRLVLAVWFLLSQLAYLPQASAASIDDCRINASRFQVVSLGFPLRAERIAYFSKPKILVVPFQLKDNPSFVFTNAMKNDYLTAAENISSFSSGLSKVEFVFAPTISTELTNADMDQLKINQREQFQKDETKSTYGFVRKFLTDHDSRLDFTGINGVILAGSSTSAFSDIAEAFMFWNKPDNPWFRPMETAEGQISNAVLLDNHSSQQTITHEIMHMFGLTDLYGSDTGPGRLSLMASNELNLLSYEKWVLGWLPNSEVQCFTNLAQNSLTTFSFDYTKNDQLAIFRAPENENYIIETTKVNGTRYLAFYSLNNEGRPPLTFFQERAQAQSGGVEIENHLVIGTQLKSTKYTLLVSNLDSSSITLNIAPAAQTDSKEFKDLVAKSSEIKNKIEQEIQNKARAAAELKAKQDAEERAATEAKLAADLKAKQDAEAKAAADKAAAQKLASQRKSTITCVKGKLVKKIIAVSPKCPSGFKKKL